MFFTSRGLSAAFRICIPNWNFSNFRGSQGIIFNSNSLVHLNIAHSISQLVPCICCLKFSKFTVHLLSLNHRSESDALQCNACWFCWSMCCRLSVRTGAIKVQSVEACSVLTFSKHLSLLAVGDNHITPHSTATLSSSSCRSWVLVPRALQLVRPYVSL